MKHPKLRFSYFNLIEIMVALSVIAVIMVSAVSLIPKSIISNQEAVNRISAADAADQVLNWLSAQMEMNWDVVESIPYQKYEGDDSGLLYSSLLFHQYLQASGNNPQISFEAPNEMTPWQAMDAYKGIFRVTYRSAQSRLDFEGVARCWYEVMDLYGSESTNHPLMLQAEISWPSHLPYEKRRKKTYMMEVYRSALSASAPIGLGEIDCKSAWGIPVGSDTLYRYVLEDEAGTTVRQKEGDIVGFIGGSKVEAVTVGSGGIIYMINNHSDEGECTLYRITPGEIDGNPSTYVRTSRLGQTGVGISSLGRITSLQVIDGKLYGMGRNNRQLYHVNVNTGRAIPVVTVTGLGSLQVGAMTVGADGHVYMTHVRPSNSEIWRFLDFSDALDGGDDPEIIPVATVKNSRELESLTAHPSGWLYAYDGRTCFRVEPITGNSYAYRELSTSLDGLDLDYQFESANLCFDESPCLTEGKINGTVSLNPSGSLDFSFHVVLAEDVEHGEQTFSDMITRDDLVHNSDFNQKILVSEVRFRPKTGGKQTGVEVDDEPFELDNNIVYTLRRGDNEPFQVNLYNSHYSGQDNSGSAMGHWKLELVNAPFPDIISFCDQTEP